MTLTRDVPIAIDVLIPVDVPIPIVIDDRHFVLNCDAHNAGKKCKDCFLDHCVFS